MPTQPQKKVLAPSLTPTLELQYIRHEQRNYCTLNRLSFRPKGNPPQSLVLVNGYVATTTVDERFVQNYMNNLSKPDQSCYQTCR